MYEDQFGEFVCGYWDLKGEGSAMNNTFLLFYSPKPHSQVRV